jgi:hypothetical protein
MNCGAKTRTASMRPSMQGENSPFLRDWAKRRQCPTPRRMGGSKIRKRIRELRTAAGTHARASTRTIRSFVNSFDVAALPISPPLPRASDRVFELFKHRIPVPSATIGGLTIFPKRQFWSIFGGLCWPSSFSPRNSPGPDFGV